MTWFGAASLALALAAVSMDVGLMLGLATKPSSGDMTTARAALIMAALAAVCFLIDHVAWAAR